MANRPIPPPPPQKKTEIECKRGLIALIQGAERSSALAKFSDRAPLTKLFHSLKNLPPQVRESNALSTRVRFHRKTQLSLYGQSFRPHMLDENDQ